jgi:hypothetical protein
VNHPHPRKPASARLVGAAGSLLAARDGTVPCLPAACRSGDHAASRVHLFLLVRRSRWLLLTMLVLFGWMTPGTPLPGLPGATREGLLLAADNLERFLIALAVVALILKVLPPVRLVAGIRSLLAPLALLNLSRDRIAVRLALTMQEVESSRNGNEVNQPAAGRVLLLPSQAFAATDVLFALLSAGIAACRVAGMRHCAGTRIRRFDLLRLAVAGRGGARCRMHSNRRCPWLPMVRRGSSAPGGPMPVSMRWPRWCISIPTPCVRTRPGCGGSTPICRRALRYAGLSRLPTDFMRASPRWADAIVTSCSIADERPGLMSGRVGWYHRPLDADAMAQAGALLFGEHDFSAFRAAECQAKSAVKTLRRAEVQAPWRPAGVRFRGQRLPAPHGAQSGRCAGVCGQGRSSAGLARGASCRARSCPRGTYLRRQRALFRRGRL